MQRARSEKNSLPSGFSRKIFSPEKTRGPPGVRFPQLQKSKQTAAQHLDLFHSENSDLMEFEFLKDRRVMACRLCECPVLDGGIHFSQLDRKAWTNWCRKYLDVELDEEDSWICQFCVTDAR